MGPLLLKALAGISLRTQAEWATTHSAPKLAQDTRRRAIDALWRPDQRVSDAITFRTRRGLGVIDWVGMMVRRASDGIKLGEYMQKHIWGPLDMTSITFHLEERPDVEARLSDMSIRTPTGDLAFIPGHLIEDPVRDDLGGGGSYSSAPDYLKVLASILRNDGQLLQTQTVHEMFKPQLSPQAKEMFQKVLTTPEVNDGMTGGVKIGTSVNWGLGGFLVEEDTDGGRRKGSLAWVGMPNLYWVGCSQVSQR